MATRFYLPSTTASAAITPATHASWQQVGGSFVRRKLVVTRVSTAMATHNQTSGAPSPELILYRQYITDPLAAQTLSPGGAWTVKGQIRGQESATAANGTLALTIRVFSGDGATNRGDMTGIVASEATNNSGSELSQPALTNRKFYDVLEDVTIPLAAVTSQDGDRLVVEVGVRDLTVAGTIFGLSFGDDSGSDLPEDATTTAADNPWVEFSGTITFQGGVVGAGGFKSLLGVGR